MTENTNTNKFTSRKFIVWIVSTLIMIACCVMGFITKETNVVTSFTGTKTTGRKQSDYKEPIRNIEDRSCITFRKRGAENLYIICIELNAIYFIFVRYNRTS